MGIHIPLARIIPVQIYISLAFPLPNLSVTFRFPWVTCRGWGYFFLSSTYSLASGRFFSHVTPNRLRLAVARDEMLHWMHP